jgi:hypothetical protein
MLPPRFLANRQIGGNGDLRFGVHSRRRKFFTTCCLCQAPANCATTNSHLPVRRRKRKMQRFKSQDQAKRFVSTHSAMYNTFAAQRHLVSRKTMRTLRAAAFAEWSAASGTDD